MKRFISVAALTAALLAPPAYADSAETLSIKDFVGTVNITTGDGFTVSGDKGDVNEIRQNGLTIEGNETIDNSRCKNMNGNVELSFGKKTWFRRVGGYKNLKDYPNIDITVPAGTHLEIRDSVIFGTGEDFGSVDAEIKSCGDLEIGNVTGPLTLAVSGSGDFKALDVGEADVRISGSGDVELGDALTSVLRISGSGDLNTGNVTGAAKVTTTGSGDVEIETLSGDLVYEGRGSSHFKAERIDGRVTLTVTGSGDVEIEDGDIPVFTVLSRGSSNIEFDGIAGDVDIKASGSGNIEIEDATGERDIRTSGSASVEIDGRNYDG